ncbi:MAG TPA: hypothetical protein EYQ63_28170 [Fuerstia sp.]|nr:hypothetical protein [Fuerstiella sp.]
MNPCPQQRCFPFSAVARLPDLCAAWQLSQTTLQQLQQALLCEPLPEHLACVAISGSLGRMEFHAASDLDLLVVVDDQQVTVSDEAAKTLFDEVWQRIDAAGLDAARPKSGGVFSQCVSWRALTDSAVRGIINEDVTTFGQRMQLLLDAQPLLHQQSFDQLQAQLLNWYVETRVSDLFEETGPFGWLRQDVQRYWRSIRSRAYWLHADDVDKSTEVNVKLRSSRAVIMAAFLRAIEVAQSTAGETSVVIAALQRQLTTTPLERLTVGRSASEASELLNSYQTVWQFLASRKPAGSSLPSEIKDTLRILRRCLPKSVTE